MMRLLLTITILLITLLPAGAVKKIQANPINLAAMIAEKGDSLHIEGYFKYYGYVQDGTDKDGYTVMRHRSGDELRYTFRDGNQTTKYPTIIVKAIGTPQEIDARLRELKYEKNGKTYESTQPRLGSYLTTCTLGPNNTLIFRTIPD